MSHINSYSRSFTNSETMRGKSASPCTSLLKQLVDNYWHQPCCLSYVLAQRYLSTTRRDIFKILLNILVSTGTNINSHEIYNSFTRAHLRTTEQFMPMAAGVKRFSQGFKPRILACSSETVLFLFLVAGLKGCAIETPLRNKSCVL